MATLYHNSIRAALRASAPIVAIPVEGHAPVCVRAKLLKGALKGVDVRSVEIVNDGGDRRLKIRGMAGYVRTSCTIATVHRIHALQENGHWACKECDKRKKIIAQGVLSPKEQRAMKLAAAQKKAEDAMKADLIAAQREERDIIAGASRSVFPEIMPVMPDERKDVLAEYSEFRKWRHVRSRGSVIRWKIGELEKQVQTMTVEKRGYEEKPRISPYAHRRRVCTGVKRVLRRKGDAELYLSLMSQIGALKAQFKALYPPHWNGYRWETTFDVKRPKKMTYCVPWQWRGALDGEGRKRMAGHLKTVRAEIRACTPPPDEDETEEMPIAA